MVRPQSASSELAALPPASLVSADQLSHWNLEPLVETAERFRELPSTAAVHHGKVLGSVFYEPSTRTRLSFESAACRLGGQAIGFGDVSMVSVAKGESLVDTIRVVERYCDVIVLRHPGEGAARLAATVASVPVVNGGDGGAEHPTQALADVYTIWREFGGELFGLRVGLAGDLALGRTAHSLAVVLAALGCRIVCVAPSDLQMPEPFRRRLRESGRYSEVADICEVTDALDVLYVTRMQHERRRDGARPPGFYPLGPELLGSGERPLILHPLPRTGEIPYPLDDDLRSKYFEQVGNGVLIRMALLHGYFAAAPAYPVPGSIGQQAPARTWAAASDGRPCANRSCITNMERGIAARSVADACLYCGAALAEA